MTGNISEQELKNRHNEEVQELHRQLDKKDEILSNYRQEHGKLEVFFRRVINAIDPIDPLTSVFEKTHRSAGGKSKSEVVAVKHITDSHMGAVQEASEIEYFNEFNPAVCDARNMGFTDSFIKWAQLHRSAYNINNAHVLMTGDLISGDIHDELRITNAFPVPEQIVRAAQIHAKQIALLSPFFEQVTVEFLTEDNHSRLTAKPQAKEGGKNSFNYLVGMMIETYIQKLPNVTFNIHTMHEKVVSVSSRNYLLMHGHGIRAWMGIPYYGIERRVARESTARQNIIMQDLQRAKEVGFHKIVHGHFHVPFDAELYSCGGAVSGTDAFDHQNGRYADPYQSAWMVHPKKGEFNRINFNLKYFK
jgi:hypothetical protein